MEKMSDFFSTIMFKAKVSRDFSMFFIFTQKVIHHFPAHVSPIYPHKASDFEYKLCHNNLVAKIEPEL